MRLRRFDDAVLWSGFYGWRWDGTYYSCGHGIIRKSRMKLAPRLRITLRLYYWSLPLSLCAGGHVISRRGFTAGVGPFYFSWSWV